MKIQKAVSIVVFLIVGSVLLAQGPYATIAYAEGQQFSVIRNGTPVSYAVDNPEVFGMSIERGDILQTGPGTYLEISIHPLPASVQIAENTSFRCDADESGINSRGELYYGRVRARVGTLSSSSSYSIRSPALVAGVRGTDFGLAHLLVRASTSNDGQTSSSEASILNRAFCFDGSVLVAPVSDSDLNHVMLGSGEMIESFTKSDPVAGAPAIALNKKPVSVEVTEFWKGRVFHPDLSQEPSDTMLVETEPLVEKEELVVVDQEEETVRTHSVRLAGSLALFLGGALVAGLAYPEYQDEGFTDSVLANVGFGGVLMSTSLIVLVYDLLKD